MAEEWELQDFAIALKEWIDRDNPSPEMRRLSIRWAASRAADPYKQTSRVPHMGPIYWLAYLPTPPVENIVVVAGLHIDEQAHAVRCSKIQTVPNTTLVL